MNKDAAERKRFAEFGEKIGIAFQIVDDLLDFVGDPDVTGKEPGNDVLTGKVTLPLIYSLKQVQPSSSNEIIRHLRECNGEESFRIVYNFINENGGIEYAYEKANELCQQGLDKISPVEDSIFYDSLNSMVKFTIARVS